MATLSRKAYKHFYGVSPEYLFGQPCHPETHFPYFKRVALNVVPNYLVAFDDLGCARSPEATGVHFYKDDVKFLTHLDNPAAYSNRYSDFKVILTPDSSIGVGMPSWKRKANIFDARNAAAVWQQYGHVVIPSLRWSCGEDYEWVMHGIPTESVFSVSRLGSVSDAEKKFEFEKGLKYMVTMLKPEAIMVYGASTDQVKAIVGGSTRIFTYPISMGRLVLPASQNLALSQLDLPISGDQST